MSVICTRHHDWIILEFARNYVQSKLILLHKQSGDSILVSIAIIIPDPKYNASLGRKLPLISGTNLCQHFDK